MFTVFKAVFLFNTTVGIIGFYGTASLCIKITAQRIPCLMVCFYVKLQLLYTERHLAFCQWVFWYVVRCNANSSLKVCMLYVIYNNLCLQDKVHRDKEAKKLRKAFEKEKEKVGNFFHFYEPLFVCLQ